MISGYKFKLGIASFARKLVERSNTPFQIIFHGNGASTDCNTTVFLPHVDDNARMHDGQARRWAGFVIHEFAHTRITGDIDFLRGVFSASGCKNTDYAHSLWNALEDGWIERWLPEEIPNAHAVLTPLVEATLAEAETSGVDWNSPDAWPFALALWSRSYLRIRVPVPAKIGEIFDEAVKELHSLDPNKAHPRQAKRNAKIAINVYWQIEHLLSESWEERQKGGKGAKGEQGERQDGPGSDGLADEDGDDGETGGAGGDIPDSAPGTLAGVQPIAVEPQPEGGIETFADREQKRKEQQRTAHHSNDMYLVSRIDRVGDGPVYGRAGSPGAKLRRELRRLFDCSAKEQWNAGKRSGVIDAGRLHRHSFDDGVFRRREETEGIDTAVVILIDVSGSTQGRVLNAEIEAADQVLSSLSFGSVSSSVLVFDDELQQVTGFGEGIRQYRRRILQGRRGGSTNDILAINYAAQVLAQRREKRKILMVLTDGDGDQGHEKTKQLTERIDKLGITCIGIGINCPNVRRAYSQHVVVKDLKELSEVSLRQIKVAA